MTTQPDPAVLFETFDDACDECRRLRPLGLIALPVKDRDEEGWNVLIVKVVDV